MTAATLEEVLSAVNVQHQRIPMFDGYGGHRCVGCDSLRGESDGPNSPRHAEHVAVEQAAAVRSWLAERLADEGLREAVAEAVGDVWLDGGHGLGCEYRDEPHDITATKATTAALAAVTAALTEGAGDE